LDNMNVNLDLFPEGYHRYPTSAWSGLVGE